MADRILRQIFGDFDHEEEDGVGAAAAAAAPAERSTHNISAFDEKCSANKAVDDASVSEHENIFSRYSAEDLGKKRIDHHFHEDSRCAAAASTAGEGEDVQDPSVSRWIPEPYQSVFSFSRFNIVQMKAIFGILRSNKNMVISAPTASGKTACLELAIVQLLMNGFSENGAGKIVYVAPNKALCDEKYGEWTQKFEAPFGLRAEILTGGTLSLELASVRTFATRCCKTHDGIARLPVQIPSDEDSTKKSHARGSF